MVAEEERQTDRQTHTELVGLAQNWEGKLAHRSWTGLNFNVRRVCTSGIYLLGIQSTASRIPGIAPMSSSFCTDFLKTSSAPLYILHTQAHILPLPKSYKILPKLEFPNLKLQLRGCKRVRQRKRKKNCFFIYILTYLQTDTRLQHHLHKTINSICRAPS